MVDSAVDLTEAAEYLHDVLLLLQRRKTTGKTSKGPQTLPILVAANKQDVPYQSLIKVWLAEKLDAE